MGEAIMVAAAALGLILIAIAVCFFIMNSIEVRLELPFGAFTARRG